MTVITRVPAGISSDNTGIVPPWLRVGPDTPVIMGQPAPSPNKNGKSCMVEVPADCGFLPNRTSLDHLADWS